MILLILFVNQNYKPMTKSFKFHYDSINSFKTDADPGT